MKTDRSSNLTLHYHFRYSQRLHTTLADRAYHIQYKVRKVIKGGAPQRKFLRKEWKLQLCPGEVVTVAKEIESLSTELIKVQNEKMEIEAQNSKLLKRAKENQFAETELHQFKEKEKEMEGVVRSVTVDKDELNWKPKHASSDQLECRGRSRTKSFEDYSQSHQRRLKRKQAADCELSLNWLHLEGFTPSKLEVLNNTTGEVETIHYRYFGS